MLVGAVVKLVAHVQHTPEMCFLDDHRLACIVVVIVHVITSHHIESLEFAKPNG